MKLVEVAKIGDYVNYDALISEEKRYEEIQRERMKWRVLKNDGKNVFLISETPTKSEIKLGGAKGYLDGPNMLDEICKELYTSDIGTARNLKVEDVNEVLGYKVDKVYANKKEVPYGIRILELEKKLHKKLEYRNTPDGKKLEEYEQTCYTYYGKNYKSKNDIRYQLIFGNNKDYSYWLSSSCVNAYLFDYCVVFSVRNILFGGVYAIDMYYSYDGEYKYLCAFRPIIMLSTSVNVTNGQDNGKTADTAWKIK